LVEVKRIGGKPTPAQRQLVAEGWPVHRVETTIDALMVLGVTVTA
jgi:hypothetical protein